MENGIFDRLLGRYESGQISRRELLLTLAAVAVGAGKGAAQPRRGVGEEGGGTAGAGQETAGPLQSAPFQTRTLNHTTLFVSDVERSVAFYRRLFGLPVQSRQENGVNLGVGPENQFLGLYRASGGADPMLHHVCLGVESFDADEALQTLEEHGVSSGRIRMRGETPELYFTDPDGLSVQIQDVGYCGGGGVLGDRC